MSSLRDEPASTDKWDCLNLFVDKNSFSKHLNEIQNILKHKIPLFQHKPNITPSWSQRKNKKSYYTNLVKPLQSFTDNSSENRILPSIIILYNPRISINKKISFNFFQPNSW